MYAHQPQKSLAPDQVRGDESQESLDLALVLSIMFGDRSYQHQRRLAANSAPKRMAQNIRRSPLTGL